MSGIYISLVADGDLSIDPVKDATPVHGHLTAKFEGASERVTLQPSWLELRSTRVDFSGVPNQRLDVRARTGDINELRPAVNFPLELRGAGGSFNGSLTGPLANPQIAGHAALSNVLLDDREIDALTADFSASENGLTIDKSAIQWSGMRRM